MNKLIFGVIALTGLMATSSFALDEVKGAEHGKEWTLEEARKKAHEYADKLDKTTEAEWAEHQKKRREFLDKWHKMTPQEKEDYRKKRQEKRSQFENNSSMPTTGDVPPAR